MATMAPPKPLLLHPSFVEELAAVSTALSRLKEAHVAEVEDLKLENADLKAQLALPSKAQQKAEHAPAEELYPSIGDPNAVVPEGPLEAHSQSADRSDAAHQSPWGLCTNGAADVVPRADQPSPRVFRQSSLRPVGKQLQVRGVWLEAAPDLTETYSAIASFKVVYPDNIMQHALSRSSRSKSKIFDIEEHWMMKLARSFGSIIRSLCSRATLDPTGPPRQFWNLICLCFIIYDLVIVPLHAFGIDDYHMSKFFDWTVTVWWTTDVFMTFRTGYFVGSRLEMRHKQIAIRYAKSWLICDVAIIVTEWVSRLEQVLASASIMRSSRAFRSLRVVRLIRVPKVKYLFDGMLDLLNSNVHILCCTMLVLSMVLVLAIHFFACMWYALGSGSPDGWVTHSVFEGTTNNIFWYIASCRWVIAQFNGRTDLDPNSNLRERFFTCVVGVALAVVGHAVFISYITKSMLDLSELVSEKTRLNRLVNRYLVTNPLPPVLSTLVKRSQKEYYDIKREAYNEEQVLAILPRHVQIDVLYEIRAPIISKHNLYAHLHFECPSVMRHICRTVVQSVSARKAEVLFRHGDVCNRMLFTDKLTLTYSQYVNDGFQVEDQQIPDLKKFVSEMSNATSVFGSAENKRFSEVPRDFWISEAALWTDWTNQGSLVTNVHGFLYGISPEDLAAAMKRYLEIYVMSCLYARHLIGELQCHENPSDLMNFEVQLVPPIHVKVTIISARDLPNVDGFFSGCSDPYCICKAVGVFSACSETRFRTPTIANNLNPVWNYSAEVGLTYNHKLKFEVWDDDLRPSRCTLLGVAQIDAEEICPDGFKGDLILSTDTHSGGCLRVKIDILDMPDIIIG